MIDTEFDVNRLKYLTLLSKTYPTIQSVSTEIINLCAILNLPKGTEHFVSDIHGEYEGFRHILRNASGSVRRKIDQTLGDYVSAQEIRTLATLIYYPELKLHDLKKSGVVDKDWYKITLKRLIAVCNNVTSKYTRSKVRKALPEDFAYIINELMTTGSKDFNKEEYFSQIIDSIIESGSADSFIKAMCHLVQNTVIDMLHIVGDIYDRGDSPHLVMEEIEKQRSVDIQWGNHDMLWMGAAAGNLGCIANAVRICLRYNNFDFLETGYGINMRPLAIFAMDTYKDDPCACFLPKRSANETPEYHSDEVIAKMHKAISVIQFKLEGQLILAHPEYGMEDRLLLNRIDLANSTITIGGTVYPLRDNIFPTLDEKDPYKLSEEEQKVVDGLLNSFQNNEKLQRHIDFLFKKGYMYRYYNHCLMFHGCIPMESDGSFSKVSFGGQELQGKALLKYCGRLARQGYYGKVGSEEKKNGCDFMWYLWCGPKSPLFGKDKMATFERYFIEDKATHKETSDPYFTRAYCNEGVDRILEDFGITDKDAVIVNGHIPVKILKGENPIKVDGRLVIIDGGMSKAYQAVTGIAGYTLVSNSHQMFLSEHEPFTTLTDAIHENKDMHSRTVPFRNFETRMKIADTDDGKELAARIEDLKELLDAYRSGTIKQEKKR